MIRTLRFKAANSATGGEDRAIDIEMPAAGLDCVLHMAQTIDEYVDFGLLEREISNSKPAPKTIGLEFRNTKRINSLGAAAWLEFIRRLQASYSFRFVYLSEPMVTLAALLPELLGKPRVPIDLFEVWFTCDPCKKHVVKLFKPSEIRKSRRRVLMPSFACDDCGNKLTPDVIESEYFRAILSPEKA